MTNVTAINKLPYQFIEKDFKTYATDLYEALLSLGQKAIRILKLFLACYNLLDLPNSMTDKDENDYMAPTNRPK